MLLVVYLHHWEDRMSLLTSSTVITDVINDRKLEAICKKALAPMLLPFRNRVSEPGDLWSAANIIPNNVSRRMSEVGGIYTRFGHCLQQIVTLIAENNNKWDASPDNRRVTDITLVSGDEVYLLFVQSQYNTKNSGGIKQIKGKMAQRPKYTGIVAVVQDYPPPLSSRSRRQELSPNVIQLVGPELFSFLSDGDDTLYARLKQAISRWGAVHARLFQ